MMGETSTIRRALWRSGWDLQPRVALCLLAAAPLCAQQPGVRGLPAAQRQPAGPLALTDRALPMGYVNLPFGTSVRASGGTGGYKVELRSGLPDGLRVATANGVVSIAGVPTSWGTYTVSLSVADSAGNTVSHDYLLRIQPALIRHDEQIAQVNLTEAISTSDGGGNGGSNFFAPNIAERITLTDFPLIKPLLTVSPATVPSGTYNTSYSQTFSAFGNNGPVSLQGLGTLPPGLSFSTPGSTITLSGTPTAVGTYTVYVTAQDNASTNSAIYPLTINPASQTIDPGPLPPLTYGNAPFTLGTTASSGLTPTITLNSGPVSGSGLGPYTITGAGTASFTATQAGNADYISATPVNFNLSIAKATLTLEAGLSLRVFDQPNPSFGYTYASNFVNGDNYSVVSGTASTTTTAVPISPVSGSPYPIVLSLGTLSAANYTFNFINGPFYIFRTTQTITFYPLPVLTNGSTFALGACASSGLAVTYGVTGPATISNNVLTVTGSGLVTVTASQSGNSNYYAATSVARSFTAP
jgi:hypothetical protein